MINGKSKRLTASTSYPSNQSVMQSTWGIRATAKVQRAISNVALSSVGSFEGRKRPQLPLHYQSLNFSYKLSMKFLDKPKGKKFTPCSFNPPKKRTRWTFWSVHVFTCFFGAGIDFSVAFALAVSWPLPQNLRGEVSIHVITVIDLKTFFGNKNPSKSAKLQFLPPIWTSKKRCEHTL